MREPLDELYFKWLYRQVANPREKRPAKTYWKLLSRLHSREFTWFIPNDDNRIADGIYLRNEFMHDIHEDPRDYQVWMEIGCSVLEMLVALSRRLSFVGGGASSEWFWHLIENLGVDFSDLEYRPRAQKVIDDAMTRLIDRTYDADGTGGLFPLSRPQEDQREIEIWYQMGHYINQERG